MLVAIFVLLPIVECSPLGALIASKVKAQIHPLIDTAVVMNATKGASRFYPELGPLSMREVFAKEAFRFMAQMALDRMPNRRYDSASYESHYYPTKKKGHLQGRQFFESEEFILFLIGVGLASMLEAYVIGMATMMAPINQLMYSGAAYGPASLSAVPATPAIQGRRRRSLFEKSLKLSESMEVLRQASVKFGALPPYPRQRILQN